MVETQNYFASPHSRTCLTISLPGSSASQRNCISSPVRLRSRQGDPAEAMFVVLEGELEARERWAARPWCFH